MTPSPAPDRLTALSEAVNDCAREWVHAALLADSHFASAQDHRNCSTAQDEFESALAALRAEAASVEERLARAEREPMQPLVMKAGVVRFRENSIVRTLLDRGPLNMNDLARMDFSDEDRMQFAQLIGYSVGGYGELSYVSDTSYERAQSAADEVLAAPQEEP